MQMEQELKTINADYKMEQIGWEEFIREEVQEKIEKPPLSHLVT